MYYRTDRELFFEKEFTHKIYLPLNFDPFSFEDRRVVIYEFKSDQKSDSVT